MYCDVYNCCSRTGLKVLNDECIMTAGTGVTEIESNAVETHETAHTYNVSAVVVDSLTPSEVTDVTSGEIYCCLLLYTFLIYFLFVYWLIY
jgi:hypothetical protein